MMCAPWSVSVSPRAASLRWSTSLSNIPGRGDGLESQDDETENLRDAPSAQPQRTRMRGGFIMRRMNSWLIPPAFMVFIGSALLVGCGDTNPEGPPPAGGTVGAIKEKAGEVAGQVGEKLGEVKEKAGELATSAVDKSGKVVEGAGQAVEKAGQNLQTTAQETVKEKLGEKTGQVVEGTGKAVEKAGQS